MDFTRAVVKIEGTAPYSQSRKVDDPWLEGESHEDYDRRTWRSKMTTELIDGKRVMCLPPFAIHMALVETAKYMKEKIKGQGNATWTSKFMSGISILGPISLGIDPDTVQANLLMMNADGRRGSGARVPRRLPQIPMGWQATFEVLILDPIITEAVFRKTVEDAGLFKGLGQFRPEKGGSNGRFILQSLQWIDNRQPVQRAA
jgi:hypothetical protein